MEREKAISNHGTIVQPFLKDAFKEGAHRKMLQHTLQDPRFRQLMIGVVYNDVGSTATLEELADKYGAFKQSIADSNKRFLSNLWNNSSPTLQDRYSLNEILTARKPLSQRSREKLSLVGGGRSLKIREQVARGVTDIDQIGENTGIPRKEIKRAASGVLKDRRINLPPERRREVKPDVDTNEIARRIRPYSIEWFNVPEHVKKQLVSSGIRQIGDFFSSAPSELFEGWTGNPQDLIWTVKGVLDNLGVGEDSKAESDTRLLLHITNGILYKEEKPSWWLDVSARKALYRKGYEELSSFFSESRNAQKK